MILTGPAAHEVTKQSTQPRSIRIRIEDTLAALSKCLIDLRAARQFYDFIFGRFSVVVFNETAN
jgi:hypothetical protein